MKKTFIVIIIFLLATIQTGYTDDIARRALAEELLVLMDTQKNIEDSFEMIKQMQAAQLQNMALQIKESEKVQLMRQKMMDMITKEMSWDKVKDDYITIYADTFTEEELKEIINFYKTQIGQKFIKKTPELMRKSMEIGQRQMEELMPKIQSMAKEMIEKWKEESIQELSHEE